MRAASWRILSQMLQAMLSFGAEKTFLFVGVVGGLCYFTQVSNLTHYPHGQQSFFHVAHLVYSMKGQPDTLPRSFYTLVYQNAPNRIRIARINESKTGNCVIKYESNGNCVRNPSMEPVSDAQLLRIPLRPDVTEPYASHSHSAQYAPISYITYLPGAALAIWLEWPPLAVMYAAILGNFAATLALGYYTLRLLPVLRWPVCFLMLSPTAFMLRSVIMPDAMLFEWALLALAFALRLYSQPQPLTRFQQGGMLLLSALIGMWKTAYVAMPMIFSIIPCRLFGGRARKYTFLALNMVFCTAVSLLWGVSVLAGRQDGSEGAMQDIFMEKTASFFSMRALYSINNRLLTGEWAQNFTGGFFTWMPTWIDSLPEIACAVIPLALLVGLRPAGEPVLRWKWPQRTVSAGIFFASFTLVFAAVHYLHDNFLWLSNKHNLQGRHLLPALPFLLMGLYSGVARPPAGQARWNDFSLILAVTSLLWLNITHLNQL